ncbi:DUF2332 domain-containing protein [Albidovulum sediminicola]|uniref:DUF2332 family protein n=1 Tax=Albidovulum sediminicola TaxID=2984331 RepID=A0ABT2YXN6_9RHOB|nr:DUF2332 family protein [Defluviimonas sp. WL0075]MCV2863629.1 DUF2332 family protein [Defluviimonas sp. WL0075]
MSSRLRDAFREQGESCAALGSPFMARLMTLLGARLQPGTPLSDRLFAWPGDVGPRGASVPLRLAGALHALRLSGHGELTAVYPPATVDDETLWRAIERALATEAQTIGRFIDSPPQTNEVRRAAVLVALAHWLAARAPLPIRLLELGASAGLNLSFDRFGVELGGHRRGAEAPALILRPDWRGTLPPASPFTVVARQGVDLAPIDIGQAGDRLRLRAYLWPDQTERLALTDAAISVAGPPPARGDAIDWLSGRLAPARGTLLLVYSTVAWQYFPVPSQSRGRALIEAAGAAATADAPLAWFGMEADDATPGAGLALRLWPGDLRIDLGRADFHGRWVDWRAPEVSWP